jgi:hypothetical protein
MDSHFRSNPNPNYELRIELLSKLKDIIIYKEKDMFLAKKQDMKVCEY